MSSLAVTNTFSNGTTADGSQVNSNFTDVVNYVNTRNSGSSSWDAVSSSSATNVPIVANNSSGTQNIANFQDNGSLVVAIANGGLTTMSPVDTTGTALTVTAANGGSGKTIVANNGTSTGNIFEVQDNGSAVLTVADGGAVTATSSVTINGIKLNGTNNWYHSEAVTLVVVRTSVTTVTVTADMIGVEEYRKASYSQAIAITTSGLNGLDTGAEGSSTWYSIWAIYNPTTDTWGGVLSASMTSPTMPAGYTKKRRVGFAFNNSGSDIDDFRIFGERFDHYKDVDGERAINGAPTTGSWTTLAMDSRGTPAVEIEIFMSTYAQASGSGPASMLFRPNGAAWTASSGGGNVAGRMLNMQVASGVDADVIVIRQNASRQIQYFAETNVATSRIVVIGFKIPVL